MKIPLNNLRAFDATARFLSFTQAAENLNLSQSAVSQQISLLENRLGLKLFRRLTRRLELTDEGNRLYETVRRCIHDFDNTCAKLMDTQTHGIVTISVGSSFASNWLIPQLSNFHIECPEIDLRIRPSDNLVDLHSDPSIDLAVRFAQGPGQDLVAKSLGTEQVFVVCSPALPVASKLLHSPQDLDGYPLLLNETSEQEVGAAGDWKNWMAALGLEGAFHTGIGTRFPRSDLLVQAAIHGQGMALVWTTMVQNELRDGRLKKPFGVQYETSNTYFATCTTESYAKPKVRSVIDWMIRRKNIETS